jgi:dTDP-4-dehydrorhamnose reductase
MNILLTGSAGQLGRELLPQLARIGTVTGVDRAASPAGEKTLQQDLGDLGQLEVLLDRLEPDVIVNAAAYTAVDRAESDAAAAYRVNAELPGRLARWTQRHDRLLVHYSTDYVFSGAARRPYREDDPTGPLSVYGESKLGGEQAIAASGCRHLVLRTSWVYANHGSNFVLTMLRLARERPTLSIVADQVGCPTWARNLASVTARALARMIGDPQGSPVRGTWHYCDSGVVSWYDFARAIFDTALAAGLLERAPRTVAVPSAEYPQAAARPMYSVLDTTAIGRDFGIEPAPLEDSLLACLEELKGHDST